MIENSNQTNDVPEDAVTDSTSGTTTETPQDDSTEPTQDSTTSKYESLEDELVRYKVALDNTLEDTELQEGFARFGYDLPGIETGNTLYANAESLFHKQKRDYAMQYSATQRLNLLMEESESLFSQDRSVARIAFKDNVTVKTELNLFGKRRRKTFGHWVHELEFFYSSCAANSGIVFGLEKFNITAEILQERLTKLGAVKTANSYQERLKGAAQRSTDRRDAALNELRSWMTDFFQIARLAFAEDKQQLEKVKILARS
jgi:hypothetical protein